MIQKLILISIMALIGTFALPAVHAAAASCTTPAECTSVGLESASGSSSGTTLPEILKTVVSLLMYVIGGVAIIMIIIGGLRYSSSQGDSSNMQAAKNTILYSVVGLIVAISGYAIVSFVAGMFTGSASTSGSGPSATAPSSSPGSGSKSPTASPPKSTTPPTPPKPSTPAPAPTPTPTVAPPAPPRPPAPTYIYQSGTYSASADYSPRGRDDTISVTITVLNDRVTAVRIVDNPSDSESQAFVDGFSANVSSVVIGQPLDTLSPSIIAGASDTTDAFNETLNIIRDQARA